MLILVCIYYRIIQDVLVFLNPMQHTCIYICILHAISAFYLLKMYLSEEKKQRGIDPATAKSKYT